MNKQRLTVRVLLVTIVSTMLLACTDSRQPVKKQVAISNSRPQLVVSEPLKTARPGEFLLNLARGKKSLSNTLVILDLDDTMITSPEGQWLGRSEMFYDLLTKESREFPEKSKKELAEYIDPLLVEVYKRVPVILTDKNLPNAIKAIKKRGARVIGMTARGYILLDMTLDQLNQMDIQFSDLLASGVVRIDEKKSVLVKDGLVLVGQGSSKGEALEGLINSKGLPSDFDRIIMIDDKKSHLDHVELAVKKMWDSDVSFLSVLCTYPQSVRPYNSVEAVQQLETFLSDWRTDSVIAKLIRYDPFTQKFIKDRASKVSQKKGQSQLLMKAFKS